jgi:3-oxoacyl-[acyl-carrier protein] reductase
MPSNSDLVLITGSNGGIGCKLTDYLLSTGKRNIACHYHSASEDIEAVLVKHDLDPRLHLFQAELTDEEEVAGLRKNIEAQLGEVWGLINMAGGSMNAMSWKIRKEDFQKVIDQNLTTTFLCSREFIPAMRQMNSGRIVNISSVVGYTGAVGAAAYCAAKAAIGGWTKALALELASKSITVNTLALGYFEYGLINHLSDELQDGIKGRIPYHRFGTANEIGGYINFLLSADGLYTTGQIIHVNGGLF